MNNEKPNYYAIIPANVRYDNTLSPNSKLLYGEITALCNQEGYCWASNGYFAKLYEVSKVTISRWVNELVEKGYIYSKMQYKEGSQAIEKRRLYLSHPINNNVMGGINNNVMRGINNNVKDNTTRVNNTSMNSMSTDDLEKAYTEIFNTWVQADIIKHKRMTRAMKNKIKSALEDYTVEEIKQAIKNYSSILHNDKAFFNYKWTLDQFCTITQKDRIANFLDLEVAKENYISGYERKKEKPKPRPANNKLKTKIPVEVNGRIEYREV